MKKKIDFVTNSSTTSFVVWGVSLDRDKILENEKLMKMAWEKYREDGHDITFQEFTSKADFYAIMDIIKYDLDIGKKLELSSGPWGDDFMVGGPVEKQRDDQTLKEYKNEIIEALKNIEIYVEDVYFISEAWRDG